MAQLVAAFTQPAPGENVNIRVSGDPLLNLDDLILFVGFGFYYVTGFLFDNPLEKRYRIQLQKRVSPGPDVVPVGTAVNTFTESVTHSTLEYSPVIAVSFRESDYRTLALTGNVILNAQHHAPGKSVSIRIQAGASQRTLTFANNWKWVGVQPSTIAANKTGVLSLTSLGNSDLEVVAAWSVQL